MIWFPLCGNCGDAWRAHWRQSVPCISHQLNLSKVTDTIRVHLLTSTESIEGY